MPTKIVPELSESEKEQYENLIRALDANELKLVRCRELGSGDPVAALCIFTELHDETLITPVAKLLSQDDRDFLVAEDRYRR